MKRGIRRNHSMGILAIVLVLVGILFLNPGVTGNVTNNSSNSLDIVSSIGGSLILLGLIAAFVFFKKK